MSSNKQKRLQDSADFPQPPSVCTFFFSSFFFSCNVAKAKKVSIDAALPPPPPPASNADLDLLWSFTTPPSSAAIAASGAAVAAAAPPLLKEAQLVSIEAFEKAFLAKQNEPLALVVYVVIAGENKTGKAWISLCDATRVLPTTLPAWQDATSAHSLKAGQWIALTPNPTAITLTSTRGFFRPRDRSYMAKIGLQLENGFTWRPINKNTSPLVTEILCAEVFAQNYFCTMKDSKVLSFFPSLFFFYYY